MIETFTYVGIAFGCNSGGMSFWSSIFWPFSAGRIIAHYVEQKGDEE